MSDTTRCPCGSGKLFTDCCAKVIGDQSKAITAEQLMRSRYSAYTLGRNDYLNESWAVETRPGEPDVEDSPVQWLGLEVKECDQGEAEDSEGMVSYTASFLSSGHLCQLHEEARFVKRNRLWYYLDGKSHSTSSKPGRNSPCPCGSGKKYKKCCLKKAGA